MIFRHACFDLELDAGALSPVEAAQAILGRLRDGPPGDALRRLAARFDTSGTNF